MESSDADDLVCPPPPVISKMSMSFGKPQPPKVMGTNHPTIAYLVLDTHFNHFHSIEWNFDNIPNDSVPSHTQPVQLKLATSKPKEPAKKITVASAFSNNDSSEDDDEEEPPVKYSRNIGR